MAEAADMTVRREQDSNQFSFTVRGHTTPDLSGSIPRQIFEAEPNSMLNKMYNGNWAYATDAAGRACINSNPAHWPLILDWVSFGVMPDEPTKAFIAECKYWQLDNLLSRLQQLERAASDEAAVAISTSKHTLSLTSIKATGRTGLQLEGSMHNFPDRFHDTSEANVFFTAFGASWAVTISEDGAFLALRSGPSAKAAQVQISFGAREHQSLFVEVSDCDLHPQGDGWGCKWQAGNSLTKLQQPPYVDLKGSLRLKVRLLYSAA